MKIISQAELELNKEKIITQIKQGAIFIHPTDTIYGISCDATNEAAVQKLREIKERPNKPLSIWAPSIEWIRENCSIEEKWLDRLPGPYTLITPFKNKDAIAPSVTQGKETLGVRIPNHWFSKIVEELNIPIITTSTNLAGEPHMTSLETLNSKIKQAVDFILYEGEKEARPSKLINTVTKEIKER